MAFDMGFDFRSSAGYVTDPAYGVPVLAESYPHTYTNGNGDSINAGWDSIGGGEDNDATNDARIAGDNYRNNAAEAIFTVDLSSGSAPGAGAYSVDAAFGHALASSRPCAAIYDNASLLIDLTNGGAGYDTGADHYIDASAADVGATILWTGTPVSKTFASTTCKLKAAAGGTTFGFTHTAHFRLTAAFSPTPSGITGMPWWLIGPTILPGSDLMRSF